MVYQSVLIVTLVLAVVAIVLSSIGIYYYAKGNRKFVEGDLKTYATWMLVGVIIYTVHLFMHLIHVAMELGWIMVNEDVVYLLLYVFLAVAGFFFLIGSIYYLKLSKLFGFKR